ncbi:DUF1648 domain-containing protein [Maribacter algarum]|uniref:DUF1648 domain-containing protein n=1 Tax=Maribacter algarum (ex Zhang et al. 2020) TaxID=2578118 RepID=A0A5S3PYJ0_9FLAO|nr:SdpI family protein [Maribacter algarum]TMM59352.1 DUF1648 domain-containing protein [Maribacter algarum]
MKYDLKQEIPLLATTALPIVYALYLWNSLPEKIPTHWNLKGEIDGWGSKEPFIIFFITIPVFIYILFLVLPMIDPKKKLQKMGKKFYRIKFFMILIMSLLAVFALYSAQNQSESSIKALLALFGFMIVGLGNYFPAVKHNYFIGIKTPWTLENETVWKETHQMAGKLWFFGGALLTLLVLILPVESSFIVFLVGMAVLTLVPLVFSYRKYKGLKS